MSKIEDIHRLIPDNESRAIEPRHIREAFGKVMESVDKKLDKPELYDDDGDDRHITDGHIVISSDDNAYFNSLRTSAFLDIVNKNLKVTNNATGDDTYTYEVVAKPNKTLGVVRKRFVDVLKEDIDLEPVQKSPVLGLFYGIPVVETSINGITDVELMMKRNNTHIIIKPEIVSYEGNRMEIYISEKQRELLSMGGYTINLKYRKLVY